MTPLADTTYVLPIRRTALGADEELLAYLASLARLLPVIVVDGSPAAVFASHAASWPRSIAHIPVDEDRRGDLNGKVAGVVTGLRRVRTAKAIVADDDVRYDLFTLRRVSALLDDADVVRPQNVFDPLPWHALLDTGRTLIARANASTRSPSVPGQSPPVARAISVRPVSRSACHGNGSKTFWGRTTSASSSSAETRRSVKRS